ncbi:MAG: hypothetical protein Q8N83_00115 [Ignavibacteria bacterium]|nr:hypothetical protein [Ignavibacteria bacterium]
MNTNDLINYKYNGARSMVLLYEKYLTSLLQTWREAKSINLKLPETDDSDYQSLETLLEHIFRAARRYMVWMCDKLNLPDPEIKQEPNSSIVESEADEYLIYLLSKWRIPLAEVEEEKFLSSTYKSNWGVDYCIDAMLEHAVMHPIRHEFQLRNLM